MATTIILTKKGQLDIEKGLEKMNWDTEEFERELELFAKTQPLRVQEKLRQQYNRYIKQCGLPWKLVVVEEREPEPKESPQETPKIEQQTEPTLKPEPETQETPALATIPEETNTSDPPHSEPVSIEEPKSTPQENKPSEKELHGHIIIKDAMQLKNLLKTVSVLLDEGTFKLTPKGLTLRGMDPARVAMVDLVILRENCEEHACTEEMKFCFSIDRYLDKTLKNVNKEDGIRLDIQTGLSKMNTRLFGKLTRQFSMPLLEVSGEEVPEPKIDFKYSARLVLENVNALFKNLEDHVRIVGTQDGLTFEETGDIENFTSTLKKGDDTVLDIKAQEDAKATYSVSYLKEMLKSLSSLTDIVEISYSTDMPIRISVELEHLGTVNFYIAPRIETD